MQKQPYLSSPWRRRCSVTNLILSACKCIMDESKGVTRDAKNELAAFAGVRNINDFQIKLRKILKENLPGRQVATAKME